MEQYTQYHFVGKGHSGRAVRLRDLDATAVDDNLLVAAKLVGPDASALELKKAEWRIAVKQMIAEISEPCENAVAAGVKWKKVSAPDLDNMADYFKPKDVTALEAIYRQNHELGNSEFEAITGKAVPVSSEG